MAALSQSVAMMATTGWLCPNARLAVLWGGVGDDSCAVPEVTGLAAASRGVAMLATGWLCPKII